MPTAAAFTNSTTFTVLVHAEEVYNQVLRFNLDLLDCLLTVLPCDSWQLDAKTGLL